MAKKQKAPVTISEVDLQDPMNHAHWDPKNGTPIESAPRHPDPEVRCSFSIMKNPRDLVAHPENPNFHPKKQVEQYLKIIRFNGWRRPITVSTRTGHVVKGHGALQASLLGGFDFVPVDLQDYENYEAEIADLLADNQLGRESEQNNLKVEELLEDLTKINFDIGMTGFTAESLAKLAEKPKAPKPKPDKDKFSEFVVHAKCSSDADQAELFTELVDRGYECIMVGKKK